MKPSTFALLSLAGLVAASGAQAQAPRERLGINVTVSARCGGTLSNAFGPYDYRLHANSEEAKRNPNNPLYLVQSAHFRPEMESLIRGGQGEKSPVAPEFDYTLRAFPNHHRALFALMRLVERERNDQPQRLRWTAECYFERGIAWAPDDVIVRMLYAKFLADRKRLDDARRELEGALALAGDNALTHHNIGMLYFDLGDTEAALRQSHKALGLGMERQQLRDRLQAAGRWQEPMAPVGAASTP